MGPDRIASASCALLSGISSYIMQMLQGRASISRLPSRVQSATVSRRLLRVQAQQANSVTATSVADTSDQVPSGCTRYTVNLKKPLGIVLEQDPKTLIITVAEIKPEGSAARSKEIAVGDQLIATSGVTYSKEDDYGGATVKLGQQVVRLRAMGETMKTVSAAIGSHPGHMPVTLEFQKCGAV